MQRGSAPSSSPGVRRGSIARREDFHRNEVTEIIPFDQFSEFGDLDDLDGLDGLDFADSDGFGTEMRLVLAADLDDLHDDSAAESPGPLPPRRGQHRKPATSPVKGRILIAAMAAGAAAAAAHSAITRSETTSTPTVLAAQQTSLGGGELPARVRGMQMVSVQPVANAAVHNEEFANGVAFAQERAEREARLQRPLFATPTHGSFTSGFGYRWGALHGGIDVANAIGTPILAVTDGVVIEAGPSAGYGMLVKLRHYDGTVTLYGHVNTTTVGVGERVMAGDQIATMGNRGNSTGPHLHFEVLLGGSERVDPVPWLNKRGLSI